MNSKRQRALIIPLLLGMLLILAASGNSALAATPGDVVINEIMQNPNAVFDSDGEWFELYNSTDADIDIDGWTIADNDVDSHVINNGGPLVIPADGYLVLGNNTDTATNGGVNVDYSYGSSWFLSNSADEVVLQDDGGIEIDRVEYDGGPVFPDPTGASMALKDPALDNNDGANWCEASTPYGDGDLGTPGAANDCPAPVVEVVINEIMQNPSAVADSAGEWFELFNPTDAGIDINGWTMADNDTDTHLIDNGAPLVIPAGGYLVLGNNADTATNGGVIVDYQFDGSSWFIGNSADEIVLFDTVANEIDRVEYDNGVTFPDPNGASMALKDPTLDNNLGENWCEASTPYGDGDFGTPGAANDCPAPVVEVVINEIMQNPSAVADSSGEWFELFNPTDGGIDINGWTIADNDSDSHVIANGSPLVIPAGGYLVLGNNTDTATNGGVTVDYSYGSSWYLANGYDEVVLLDGASNEVDRVEYDDGATFPDPNGASMSLKDPDLDNNDGANWCTATTAYGDGDLGTPGAENDCVVVTITPIYDIQYTTDPSGDSPYKDQSGITTAGIVTGVFYNGYFIEDPAGGAWNGIFVYDSHTPSLGDWLMVTGTVIEFNNLTEMSSLSAYSVLSNNNPIPGPEVLLSGELSQEQWESVFVRVSLADVVDPDLGFGEWSVDNCSGPVRVDDLGDFSYVPVAGDLLAYIQGPLYYSFGDFKIVPRNDGDIMVGAFTPIYEIQGNGAVSPFDDQDVLVEGVVTADFQKGDELMGFNLQDQTGDGLPETSDGVFVFHADYFGFDVNAGDLLRLEGTVDEYWGLTEIKWLDAVVTCGYESIPPTEVILPLANASDWEQYEGMLVNIPQELTASDNYNLGRWGEMILSVNGRLDAPTNVADPGAPAIALQDLNDRSVIQLDDGSNVENPLPLPPYLGADKILRAGDTIPGITGVIGYAFDAYEIHPIDIASVDFAEVNARPGALDVGGSLKVASFNVLNYFTTLDTGPDICGPDQNLDCRGANTPEEFTRQRDKIIAAILAMDADVVGLMEMENHHADEAIQDLVNGLNDVTGAGTYAYIDTGPVGSDAIKVGIIYKPSTAEPIGPYAILDSSFDPDFIDTKSRPVIAQTFQEIGTDDMVTVAVNHLKSKSSACDDVGDPDVGDGQGNCNVTRTKAATVLAAWLATDPTGAGSGEYLIIGDLNSYAKEDPITALKAAGYTDLLAAFATEGETPYSYVYFGQAGYLDHGLSSPDLLDRVTGAAVWHINADEPNALNYNDYNQPDLYSPDQWRASDHDPVVIGICETTAPVVDVDLSRDTLWAPNHKYRLITAEVNVTDADPNPTITLVSVESNEPDDGLGDGDKPNDIVIVNDFTFMLRAERSGTGDGRVYTVTYMVTDSCGNTTTATATVTVPHNQFFP